MQHHPFPERPPGICGAVWRAKNEDAPVFPFRESEHLFSSPDGKAAFGLTLRPPREHLGLYTSSDTERNSFGIAMGMFYEPSLLETRPHDAHTVVGNPFPHCNGLFLSAGYAHGALTIVTSPYGSYPLYYFHDDNGIMFSTCMRDLLANMSSSRWHRPAGIAQWLVLDRTIDGGTIWEGIERFQAASIYTFDTRTCELNRRRYWQPAFGEDSSESAIVFAAEAYADAVRRIADRGLGNVAAAITGGIDSRNIWSVLGNRYPDITAVTHHMVDGTDIRIAKNIAKRLGITHRVYRIGEEFTASFESSLRNMLLTTNGSASAENAHQPHIYDFHVPWTDTLIDGINACLERNISMRRVVPANASDEELIDRTYRWLRHDALIALLEPERRAEYESLARQSVSEHYALCDTGLPPKVRADELYVRFMEPNYRNDLALLQFYYNQFASPFFDMQYTKAITALREDIRAAQRFQQALVGIYAPQLRRLPRSHADVRTLPVSNWKLQLLPLAVDRYIGARLENVVPKKLKPYTRLRRPSLLLDGIFRSHLQTSLDSVLRGLPDCFNKKGTEAFLTAYISGMHTNTPVAGRLIAMSSPWSHFTLNRFE